MLAFASVFQWIMALFLILSSLGVVLFKKPVHASLSFLLTLLSLAYVYIDLSAAFIGVMQVIVYAGAILVIFMFVIVLFQDAHDQIDHYPPLSSWPLLVFGGSLFLLTSTFVAAKIVGLSTAVVDLPPSFGTVESLGMALYVDYFFPFEAVILIFLVALVGALYCAKRGN